MRYLFLILTLLGFLSLEQPAPPLAPDGSAGKITSAAPHAGPVGQVTVFDDGTPLPIPKSH